jgi:hypothetical protein
MLAGWWRQLTFLGMAFFFFLNVYWGRKSIKLYMPYFSIKRRRVVFFRLNGCATECFWTFAATHVAAGFVRAKAKNFENKGKYPPPIHPAAEI